MTITHVPAPKTSDRVIIDLSEEEAIAIANWFLESRVKRISKTICVLDLADDLIKLTEQW